MLLTKPHSETRQSFMLKIIYIYIYVCVYIYIYIYILLSLKMCMTTVTKNPYSLVSMIKKEEGERLL